ncbi:flagellar basal body-associated FliL family protein [Rhodobacter sp. NSM]|uniref:flagellar basal body-associated FliL family protein n=1 Tax=Rhodobacter sp. NSM TaxID=3457501 RepID=UPI003FD61B65
MLKLIIPLFLAIAGLGAGVGAGIMLRPEEEPQATAEDAGNGHGTPQGEPAPEGGPHAAAAHEGNPEEQPDYVKLNNQFIVPIVENGRVSSMMILSLSLEVPHGGSEQVYAVEPKLRDGMLSVLFDHANTGGFRGSFTESQNLVALRRALMEVARSVLGPSVSDVLITDIMRQDS